MEQRGPGPCMVTPFKDLCLSNSIITPTFIWHIMITSRPRRCKHYLYESMRQREEFILWRFRDWSVKTYYKYGCQRNPDVSQIPPSQFKMQFKAIATSFLLLFVAQMAKGCTSLSRLYSFASRQKNLTILFADNSGDDNSVRSLIFKVLIFSHTHTICCPGLYLQFHSSCCLYTSNLCKFCLQVVEVTFAALLKLILVTWILPCLSICKSHVWLRRRSVYFAHCLKLRVQV
jgi:hypothetical protein